MVGRVGITHLGFKGDEFKAQLYFHDGILQSATDVKIISLYFSLYDAVCVVGGYFRECTTTENPALNFTEREQ